MKRNGGPGSFLNQPGPWFPKGPRIPMGWRSREPQAAPSEEMNSKIHQERHSEHIPSFSVDSLL